jgi:hypothetical protein
MDLEPSLELDLMGLKVFHKINSFFHHFLVINKCVEAQPHANIEFDSIYFERWIIYLDKKKREKNQFSY